jgi:hypothetical protein
MEFHYKELENGIRIIELTGRLDAAGAGEIETTFAEHCSGDQARVVVDLPAVDFVASAGIRLGESDCPVRRADDPCVSNARRTARSRSNGHPGCHPDLLLARIGRGGALAKAAIRGEK